MEHNLPHGAAPQPRSGVGFVGKGLWPVHGAAPTTSRKPRSGVGTPAMSVRSFVVARTAHHTPSTYVPTGLTYRSRAVGGRAAPRLHRGFAHPYQTCAATRLPVCATKCIGCNVPLGCGVGLLVNFLWCTEKVYHPSYGVVPQPQIDCFVRNGCFIANPSRRRVHGTQPITWRCPVAAWRRRFGRDGPLARPWSGVHRIP